MCSHLFKAHILTGSDTTSKIGAKAAAIKCGRIDYLNSFGLEYSIKSQFENAEKYLVAVLQKNSKSENFDELRYEQYIDKSKSLTELAPTSSSIEGHLSRCYYVVYNPINVLKVIQSLDSVMYGLKSTHDGFLPEKREKEMPAEYIITCNYKIRCTTRCKCVKNDVFCTIFCKCPNQKCDNH